MRFNKLASRKACSYWPQGVIRTLQAPTNCCLPFMNEGEMRTWLQMN